MELRITQTRPQIGIETQRASLELRNNGKIDFRMSQTQPAVEIRTTNAKLHIDQTQAFGDANLKTIRDFGDENAQMARQQAMDYIAQRAQEGDRLARIETKENAIANMAKESTVEQVDFTYGVMPAHGPDISVEEGEVNVELIRGQVQVESNNVPIETTFIPQKVNIYMLREPSLDIEFVGKTVDIKI